jgi:hypothetical protein
MSKGRSADGVTLSLSKGRSVGFSLYHYIFLFFSQMKLAHNYYVYIVQCKDGFYYTGITNNLEKRIDQHNEGKDIFSFTYKRRLVALKYFEHFTDVNKP